MQINFRAVTIPIYQWSNQTLNILIEFLFHHFLSYQTYNQKQNQDQNLCDLQQSNTNIHKKIRETEKLHNNERKTVKLRSRDEGRKLTEEISVLEALGGNKKNFKSSGRHFCGRNRDREKNRSQKRDLWPHRRWISILTDDLDFFRKLIPFPKYIYIEGNQTSLRH